MIFENALNELSQISKSNILTCLIFRKLKRNVKFLRITLHHENRRVFWIEFHLLENNSTFIRI